MDWNETAVEDTHQVIALNGEIDLKHSPRMRELLQTKVKQKVPVLLLDFTNVTYIDSSGLATLVEYYKNSRGYSGKLGLFGLSDRVSSVFALVGLSDIFNIFSNEAKARAKLLG